MEETEDVQTAEAPATEPSTENKAVESSEVNVSEDAQTPPSETDDKRTVPYARFKEVNDQLKNLKTLKEEYGAMYQAPSKEEEPKVEYDDAEARLQEIVGKAIEQRFGDSLKIVREQRIDQQINVARERFEDFDEHIGDITEILKSSPGLKDDSDPIGKAYLMAKGLRVSQVVSKAKEAGKQEAYETIDQKVATRTTSPTPRKMGGESDLLTKFKAGKLSEEQVRSNWSRLNEELAAAHTN